MAKSATKPGPVRNAQKYKEFGSNDAVAIALLSKYPDMHWTVTPRSLGTQIGRLDKGDRGWWINNPDKAMCLAELLEVPLTDLGVHGPAISSHTFNFDDFPEIPPLDLNRGKAWSLSSEQLDSEQINPTGSSRATLEHWLQPSVWVRRPPYSMEWLHVEDDLERQLLAKSLAATSEFDVIFVELLADIGMRLRGRNPLIISLSADGGDEDLASLALRPQDSGTLIIAPFKLPARVKTNSSPFYTWEDLNMRGQEAASFRLPQINHRWTWTFFPDWRSRLLKWVERYVARLDTLFSLAEMEKWLDRFDPHGEWFCTTTDMLQLCRMGHNNIKNLPAPTAIGAGDKLAESLFSNETSSVSFQVKQLAEARWRRRDLPWQGALPLETWLSLAPLSSAKAISEELNAIAEGKSRAQRIEIAGRVANILNAGNPDVLLDRGLIKRDQRGNFDFQHRTLAGLFVRDRLMRQIAAEPLASWAMACFDAERRPLVDAALNAVSILNLVDVTERLNQEARDSPVAVGVSEALFMALARRIEQVIALPAEKTPAVMSIARRVLARLDLTTVEWAFPKPWTRPCESQDEELEWITACWAWSQMPDTPQPMSENWLFPGWSKSLGEMPHWLSSLWPDENSKQLSSAWVGFFIVVDQWMKDLKTPIANAPRILKMGLLRKAACGEWPAEWTWWQDLIDDARYAWTKDSLLERINLGGVNAPSRLWPSYLEFERRLPDRVMFQSRIRSWLIEQPNAIGTLELLDDASRYYLASVPESLPPALSTTVVSHAAGLRRSQW